MSTSANQNDKGKTIVIDSSSSDSESESAQADLKNDKGKTIVIDLSSSDSESGTNRADLKYNMSPEYYEPVQLCPVNPVASSSHRPVPAQPIPSSLQPPPHLWNFRAIQMPQNYLNPGIENMSYEDLIRLGEVIGNASTGLSEERIHELMWRSSYSVSSRGGSSETTEYCVVCLESLSAGEDVGVLNCGHKFHTICIIPWLKMKNLCPICKAKALVGPNE